MQEAVNYLVSHELLFMLILARVAAFGVAIPVLDGLTVPLPFKVFLTVSLSLLLLPMVNRTLPSPELLSVSLALAGEVFMGLMIGFGVRALFSAVAIGAELSGLQMGFGVVTLYNPLSGQADSVTARLVGMMAIILFFAMNAHHLLIQVLVLSFARVPFSGVTLSAGLFSHLVVLSGNMFYFGMKIAVPVMISLLLANGSLGLLSRLVPQVNIFMTSFAVTIGLGLIVLGASLSIVAALIQDQISGLDRTLIQLTRELGGG